MSLGRRQFVINGLMAAATLPVVAKMLGGERAAAQDLPTVAIDPATHPLAQSLLYVVDATTSTFRKDATQFCKGCQSFQKGGLTAEGKTGEYGKCLLFQDGLVCAQGWCSAWNAKTA